MKKSLFCLTLCGFLLFALLQGVATMKASVVASQGGAPLFSNDGSPMKGNIATRSFAFDCTYTINPTTANFQAIGGNGTVAVTASANCPWTATSHEDWITITDIVSAPGGGTVRYSVAANPLALPRPGSMTIAGQNFLINQAGLICQPTLQPASLTFSSGEASGSFQVNTPNNCQWRASVIPGGGQSTFITLTSGEAGTGNGTVNFSVGENSSGVQRSNSIKITPAEGLPSDARSFTVIQEGVSCAYSLSTINQSVESEENEQRFDINAAIGCNLPTPVSNAEWISTPTKVPGIPDVNGKTTYQYTVSRNVGFSWRSGTITVGNQLLWVYQDSTECPALLVCYYFPQACGGIGPSRAFRDNVLAQSERGRNYTQLYYQVADEAVRVLTLNPMLLLRTSDIMQRYKPAVEAMVKGEPVTLTTGDLEEIDNFLNAVAAKGSDDLQQSVQRICTDLRDTQVQKEFKVTVVKGAKHQLSSTNLLPRRFTTGFAILLGFCPLAVFGGQRRRRLAKGARLVLVATLSAALSNLAPMAATKARPFARPLTSAKRSHHHSRSPEGEAYAKLPLAFEPNAGQAAAQAKFTARGYGYRLALEPTAATLTLTRQKAKSPRQTYELPTAEVVAPVPDFLRMEIVGANTGAAIEGMEELESKSNYFIGNDPMRWRTGVANYAKVRCAAVYEGVDLIYYGNGGGLEYDFKLAPGADYKSIALAFSGARQIELDGNGDLVMKTANGSVRQHKPVAYQEINGVRKAVACHYRPLGERHTASATNRQTRSRRRPSDSERQTDVVGFEVGAYDASRPLIIDPALVYSTYLGGSGDDEGNSITVDASGNAYLAGFTNSIDFPTANAAQPTQGGGQQDAFVAKLNATGTALVYATYFGGNGQDNASSIAVDPAGNAYVTGYTGSMNFPVKNAMQALKRGAFNAFVMKLNATGSLLYATHVGGSANDAGTSIAVDATGKVYLSGIATSSNFPTQNAVQANAGGASDAFVARLNAAGDQLLFSTYLGATGSDAATSLAIDVAGNVYVTGVTTSHNFQTVNAVQSAHGGGLFDGFVARLNPDNHQLLYASYLGGSGEDRALRIAVDPAGNAYVTGDTDSINFPTAKALQQNAGGGGDAFVAKINPSGTTLIYSTYLGGSRIEGGTAIAVDAAGSAYVTGFTGSTNFPTVAPLQPAFGGGSFDGFVAKLNAAGSALDYSTYLGGSGIDSGFGLAVDASGNAYLMGVTDSSNFPTAAPLQASYGGGTADVFVAKIKAAGPALNRAEIQGKHLLVFGSGFDVGAKILINGEVHKKTGNDEQNPTGQLFGKKAGKLIERGQTVTLQVKNADGSLSNEIRFTRP